MRITATESSRRWVFASWAAAARAFGLTPTPRPASMCAGHAGEELRVSGAPHFPPGHAVGEPGLVTFVVILARDGRKT